MFKRSLICFLLLALAQVTYAERLSVAVFYAPKLGDGHACEPKKTSGERAYFRYQPRFWDLRDIQGFVETSVAHYHSPNLGLSNHDVTIIAIAPVVRFSIFNTTKYTPYIDMSIGGSWLSRSDFGGRKLGGHYQFQDMMGTGIRTGNFHAGVYTMHYSNAGLVKNNEGITIPLLFSAGWQF